MALERLFGLSSISLVAIAFFGLSITGVLPLGLVIVGALALLLSAVNMAGWRTGRLDVLRQPLPRGLNLLLSAAFLAFILDLFFVSQDLLSAAVHFLIALMVVKLFTLRRRKDFLHLYAISLLELLASAASTTELWYAAVFLAYLFVAIWVLLLYHLRNEEEERQQAGHSQEGAEPALGMTGILNRRFFWTTNAVALATFCLTLVLFFVIPRIGIGYFQKTRGDLIRTSGFSDKVDLGMIGSVKLDPTIVMRVEFPDLPGPIADRMHIYFRGAAYDTYNGRAWSNRLGRGHGAARTSDGFFKTTASQSIGRSQGVTIRQEILIEALDTTALFGASYMQEVKSGFPIMHTDDMGAFYLPYPAATRFQYTAISVPSLLRKADREVIQPDYSKRMRERFLQLPVLSPEVRELAVTITQGAVTQYEKVRAIERYLRINYRYSLNADTAVSGSPIEDFLFVRKTGYCEHYASAMVMLLRTLGIPARLITGFLPGEWNDFGHYYSVRQQDAHAWVEVYFPQSGWVTFDPTPSIQATAANAFLTDARKLVDSVRLQWHRYVVRYSVRDQVAIVQDVRGRSEQVRQQALSWMAAAWGGAGSAGHRVLEFVRTSRWGALAAAIGLVLCGWLVWVARGWVWWGRRIVKASHEASTQVYGHMLGLLARRGLIKPQGSTPLEFVRTVQAEWEVAAPCVQAITDWYYRFRFGPDSASLDDVTFAHRLLADLQSTPRSKVINRA